jgi:hypothetical protein
MTHHWADLDAAQALTGSARVPVAFRPCHRASAFTFWRPSPHRR